jgi:hypothetical protein
VILVARRTDATPSDLSHESRHQRLGERRDPVEPRHEDLRAVVLERRQNSFGDELGLRDQAADGRVGESLPLREAGRLDESREDRVDVDAARAQLCGDRA